MSLIIHPDRDSNASVFEREIDPNTRVVEAQIQQFEGSDRRTVRILDAADKIFFVLNTLISVGMILAVAFLPAWAPWGIGLPSILILGIIRTILNSKSESLKQRFEALLHLRGMVDSRSFKALLPKGEWDLPAIDPHLKSDAMMKDILMKSHPSGALDIARMTSAVSPSKLGISKNQKCCDIEITPFVKIQAAHTFSQLPSYRDSWQSVIDCVSQAKKDLKERKVESYLEEMGEARARALVIGGSPPNMQHLSIRPGKEDYLHPIEAMQSSVKRLHREIESLHIRGAHLYNTFHTKWDAYVEKYSEFLELVYEWNRYEEDLSRLEEFGSGEMLNCFQMEIALRNYIDTSTTLRAELASWFSSHPTSLMAEYLDHLAGQNSQMLSQAAVRMLGRYERTLPIEELTRTEEAEPELLSELKPWLEKHYDLRMETVGKIIQRHLAMRSTIQNGYARLRQIGELPFEQQALALSAYKKDHVSAINKMMGYVGEASFWRRVGSALFGKVGPAFLPFDQTPLQEEDQGYLRLKKIRELRINQHLEKIDSRMLLINRIKILGLEQVVSIALLIVSMVVSGNIWVAIGTSVGMLGIQLGSKAVDLHLKTLQKRKQGLKLQKTLWQYTAITEIPGTASELEEVNRVSRKHGVDLEGVHATWGRVLGEKAPLIEFCKPRTHFPAPPVVLAAEAPF